MRDRKAAPSGRATFDRQQAHVRRSSPGLSATIDGLLTGAMATHDAIVTGDRNATHDSSATRDRKGTRGGHVTPGHRRTHDSRVIHGSEGRDRKATARTRARRRRARGVPTIADGRLTRRVRFRRVATGPPSRLAPSRTGTSWPDRSITEIATANRSTISRTLAASAGGNRNPQGVRRIVAKAMAAIRGSQNRRDRSRDPEGVGAARFLPPASNATAGVGVEQKNRPRRRGHEAQTASRAPASSHLRARRRGPPSRSRRRQGPRSVAA